MAASIGLLVPMCRVLVLASSFVQIELIVVTVLVSAVSRAGL